ncbi:MAG: type II secretion system major pseudopilin GspG [Planctomycetes bacterium]|nr:type II secretion system major pseudopilin GspG [Planctomycetota bacterium]
MNPPFVSRTGNAFRVGALKERMWQRGFTLIEIMVVVVIIGILATIVAVKATDGYGKAQEAASRAAVKEVSHALELFKLAHSRYPDRLDELIFRPAYVEERAWKPLLPEVPLDGWQRSLAYHVPGTDGFSFDVVSLGEDGIASDDDLWNHARR